MTEVMSRAEWGIPSAPVEAEQGTAATKRPISPNAGETRSFKTQRSISDVLGPEIDQVHLVDGPAGATDGVSEADREEIGTGETTVDPALLAATDALLNSEDQDDTDGAGHRVRDLIGRFEPVKEEIASIVAQKQESILQIPHAIVSKTVDELKSIGLTVVEGVKGGARTIAHEMEKVVEIIFDLPKCALEEHPQNNIHVPHPDKQRGMIGLGMNIQKDTRGHTVRSIVQGGVAEKSKVQNNDVVISVNGNDVREWEFEDLQRFFGSLKGIEFKIVVEREVLDESKNSTPKTIEMTIKLNLEDDEDKVKVNVAIVVTAWRVQFYEESQPCAIIQNNLTTSTKFLTIKNGCFCMAIDDQSKGQCTLLNYWPTFKRPTVIFNIAEASPLDLGTSTRVGVNHDSLRDGDYKHDFSKDTRFFFVQSHPSVANAVVFEHASNEHHYLTVDDDDKLTSTVYSSIDDVEFCGQFNIVTIPDSLTAMDKLNKKGPKIKGQAVGLNK